MTITAQVVRLYRRIDDLWPREVLENEMTNWFRAWDKYCGSLRVHIKFDGRINNYRITAFKTIFRMAVERIQSRLAVIEILERRAPEPR